MMHRGEKSDLSIVAAKPANSVGRPEPELVERREGAKENTAQASTRRTPSRASVSPGRDRVRTLRRQTSKVGAGCGNAARPVLCGGCPVMGIPTAIVNGYVE